jgi:NADPH:quinone reductase-like Zn-dependent oxidoreductase
VESKVRAYHFKSQNGGKIIEPVNIDKPEPGPGEVRVRVEAASLNYRDLIIGSMVGQGGLDGRIPLSDGAGTIEAVGPRVERWRLGDRVVAHCLPDWISGPYKARYAYSGLGGGAVDGMLAEYVVLPQTVLLETPAYLTSLEAATLPCAGVTAWHGLVARAGLAPESTLVVQGTGGVALFGLQFAHALGARVIALSSSDEKLARAKALGASVLINYRTSPNWEKAVLEATEGEGASHILELGGPDTCDRSLRSVAAGGKIIQIGVLTGFGAPKLDLSRLKGQNTDLIGVTIGSGAHFAEMNAFLAKHAIHPVIDRVFDFKEAQDAYEHLRSGAHFGKVVVTIQ